MMIFISKEERTIARAIPDEFKYIARNENGKLWIFTRKPIKCPAAPFGGAWDPADSE